MLTPRLSALLLAPLPCLHAYAQDLKYRVDIAAPLVVASLLRDNLDLVAWRDHPGMHVEQLRALLRLAPGEVRELLAAQGYFRPEVTTQLVRDGDIWVVRIQVDPGEQARVDSVEIVFKGPIAADPAEADRLARLRTEWTLPRGAAFSQPDWDGAKRSLLRGLVDRRFPAARIVDSSARVDPAAATVALALEVDSGPAYEFGPLQVAGLVRYPRDLIDRFATVAQGDTYAQDALTEFQAQLLGSGYFEYAYVGADVARADGARIPVQVTLKEKPSERVGFGVGASTDTGPRFQVEYDDLNLRDRAWRLTSGLKLEGRRQTATTQLRLPPASNRDRFRFGATLERTDLQGERTRRLIVGAARERSDGGIERTLGVDYTAERQDIAEFGSDTNLALYASHVWMWHRLDDPVDPRRGYLLRGEVGGALKALGSTQDFARLHARSAARVTLAERHTFTLRLEVGSVIAQSREGIPSNYLWRTGGDSSIRGYDFQSIGVPRGAAIVGGRYLAVGSAEYLYRVTGPWGVVLFYDVGSAGDSPSELDAFQGAGLGGRYQTPVGAVGVDVAYGIERREVRLHFSLGFTF